MVQRIKACKSLVVIGVCFFLSLTGTKQLSLQAATPGSHFEPTWESLSKHKVPEWFKDAKFGIYAHWGVYCIPAFGNEWYPRNMYRKGSPAFKHHRQVWGDQSRFGYKDFIPMFKAEKFDADAWADLYAKAGARFAGPVAEHHDGFSMWASKVNRWNAADMGPKRDIVGELVRALRKRNLKIITSFHHGFNFQGYYVHKKGWDTGDPQYGDLYGNFKDPEIAHERWLAKIKEVIDNYQPDQIWFDFGLAKIPDQYKRRMAAYYYNKEAEWGKNVIITRKDSHLPEGVGVLDIERGKMKGEAPFLWQTDDSIAINSWCWVQGLMIKPAKELVHELVDIVSKNGVLLLNVCPKADGTFPHEEKQLLLSMGKWLQVNGEAIYGSRPWVIHGEGPNLFDKGRGFSHAREKKVKFDNRDFRFTTKGDTLYAICLGWPEGDFTLHYPRIDSVGPAAEVQLLGYAGKIAYQIDKQRQLVVHVPKLTERQRPCRFAYTFKLSGFKISPGAEVAFARPDAIILKADRAVLEGKKINTEQKGTLPTNIGFWDNPQDRVHWLVKFDRAGSYLVRGEFAATNPTRLQLKLDGKTLKFPVPSTADWQTPRFVKIGSLQIERPGVYHLILQPADVHGWHAVNLWQIQFAPAD